MVKACEEIKARIGKAEQMPTPRVAISFLAFGPGTSGQMTPAFLPREHEGKALELLHHDLGLPGF